MLTQILLHLHNIFKMKGFASTRKFKVFQQIPNHCTCIISHRTHSNIKSWEDITNESFEKVRKIKDRTSFAKQNTIKRCKFHFNVT